MNRRTSRLHGEEPVRLGPTVAAKEKHLLDQHSTTLAQLLRQVDRYSARMNARPTRRSARRPRIHVDAAAERTITVLDRPSGILTITDTVVSG